MITSRIARSRLGRLVLAVSITAVALPGMTPTASTAADAASYVCPFEDRTTRPNSGGPVVRTFPVKGVDRSHWDAPISFPALKAAGQTFAFFKATQGTYMVDATYASQSAAARKAGLLVGAYHFFDYRISGTAQARYFVAAVKARGGFHGRLLPVVDVECHADLGRPVRADAVIRLRAFITEVRRLIGVKPIVYTSIYEWNNVTGGSSKFGDTKLWSAEWATTAPLKFPPGWTLFRFWQYGPLRFGDIKMDGNVYKYSLASLKTLIIP